MVCNGRRGHGFRSLIGRAVNEWQIDDVALVGFQMDAQGDVAKLLRLHAAEIDEQRADVEEVDVVGERDRRDFGDG